jgi:hypothetical protein
MYGGFGKLWRQLLYRRMPGWRRAILALVMVLMAPVTIPLLLVPTVFYGGLDNKPLRWRMAWIALAVCLLAGILFLAAGIHIF